VSTPGSHIVYFNDLKFYDILFHSHGCLACQGPLGGHELFEGDKEIKKFKKGIHCSILKNIEKIEKKIQLV
jgi:hypothetical protein